MPATLSHALVPKWCLGIAVAIIATTTFQAVQIRAQSVKLQATDQLDVKKLSSPLVAGQFPNLSGAPAILADGDLYRMFFTSPNLQRLQGAIAEATSSDLENWTPVNTGNEVTGKGLVLLGQVGKWNEQLETAFAIKNNDTYYLYYVGCPKVGWPTNPGQIGVATSSDGIRFTHKSSKPILAVTADNYDANGLYSPAVIKYQDRFLMIYAGHCYASNRVTPGIYLLSASSHGGLVWTKNKNPILSPMPTIPWLEHGVTEPALVLGPDANFYLFFTANLGDEQSRCIAVGRSANPLGPYTVASQPILKGTPGMFDEKGVQAPHVLIEGDRLRMWYLTSHFEEPADVNNIGYAEMPWPLAQFNDVLK